VLGAALDVVHHPGLVDPRLKRVVKAGIGRQVLSSQGSSSRPIAKQAEATSPVNTVALIVIVTL
jgi:microcompartment protein CcmK/EutM